MKPVEDITAADFAKTIRFELSYGMTEAFVIARIGRFYYAVSIEHGYAYTRPQLIAKYRTAGAQFEVIKPR